MVKDVRKTLIRVSSEEETRGRRSRMEAKVSWVPRCVLLCAVLGLGPLHSAARTDHQLSGPRPLEQRPRETAHLLSCLP